MQTKKTVGSSLKCITEIPLAYLHECFRYCEATGKLFWKVRPLEHFSSQHVCDSFNTRWSGKQAGKYDAKGYLYVRITDHERSMLLKGHHVIWVLCGNQMIPGFHVDHCDGNPSNNRIGNLRHCAPKDNMKNKKVYSNNKTGCVGLRKTRSGKWNVRLQVELETINVGNFDTYEEAVEARKIAEEKYYGEFARERSPELSPEDEKWLNAIGNL